MTHAQLRVGCRYIPPKKLQKRRGRPERRPTTAIVLEALQIVGMTAPHVAIWIGVAAALLAAAQAHAFAAVSASVDTVLPLNVLHLVSIVGLALVLRRVEQVSFD